MNAPLTPRTLVNPFILPTTPTLADVAQQITTSDLKPTNKRDYLSALSRVSELLHEPLSSLPADPEALRARLEEASPTFTHLSPKTWANLRSNLLTALEVAGFNQVLRTAKIPLTPEWHALVQSLPDRRFREGLSRFNRFCSGNSIAPQQVDTEVLLAFSNALQTSTFARKTDTIVRDTATLWNRLVHLRPELDLNEVMLASRRQAPTRVDLSALPASFVEDLEAYLAWALGQDLFDPNARTSPLAPKTVQLRRQQIQSAVTALVQSGTPAGSLLSLGDLVTLDAVRSILRRRYEHVGRIANAYNDGIGKTLVSIAREWVKVDRQGLVDIKQICAKLPAVRPDMTDKNKALLRHFDDPEALPRLFNLPLDLWQSLQGVPRSERSLARAQAAVAIAILLYAPLRVANLAALEIGATLILPNHRDGQATIEIPAHKTKNRAPYKVVLPARVTEMIRAFEEAFLRPLGSKLIFDNGKGQPKQEVTVSWLIERTIRRHMGFKMTQHQFRHLAAKIILDEEPGAYPLLSQLLGHANLKTAVRFYAGLDTKRAARHHAMLLERTIERHKAATASPVKLRRRVPTGGGHKNRGSAR
jgi:integrase